MPTAHLCPGERLSDLVPSPSQHPPFEVDTERHCVLCVTRVAHGANAGSRLPGAPVAAVGCPLDVSYPVP